MNSLGGVKICILGSGLMPKVPITITVDEEILNNFKEVCGNNDIKISTKINTLMKDWIEENNK